MNREIKFRAWNIRQNEYLPVVKLDFKKQIVNIGVDYNDSFVSFSDMVLEQYTGLKDKNGKEIYEGDIVEMDGLCYLIKWDGDNCKWCMSLERDWMDYLFLAKRKTPFIEIIGNIHEGERK